MVIENRVLLKLTQNDRLPVKENCDLELADLLSADLGRIYLKPRPVVSTDGGDPRDSDILVYPDRFKSLHCDR